jgi:DNA modification methylase
MKYRHLEMWSEDRINAYVDELECLNAEIIEIAKNGGSIYNLHKFNENNHIKV